MSASRPDGQAIIEGRSLFRTICPSKDLQTPAAVLTDISPPLADSAARTCDDCVLSAAMVRATVKLEAAGTN